MGSRRETEQQLENLRYSREQLVREAISWYREMCSRVESTPFSDNDDDYSTRVAVYFDRERKQPVAKVMVCPRGSDTTNFCILFDADVEKLDDTFTQERWLDRF